MRKSAVIAVLFGILLLGCAAAKPRVVFHTQFIQKSVEVELADEPAEWARGLMYRESLAPDTGMLFVFPNDHPQTFWMKNTKIPLDLLFINSAGTIVDIRELQPCTAEPCETYTSKSVAKYVLEVNAGFAKTHDIAPGVKVSLP